MGSPIEEIKTLAKSTLARQIKDLLAEDESAERAIVDVRRHVENFIIPKPANRPVEELQGLARSVLAFQIREVLDDENMSPEEKVEHVRWLIQYFIIKV